MDEIENQYIRSFNEARTHFAIICGAYSCPKLQRFVYRGDQLQDQLKRVETDFYKNPLNFQIDEQEKQVKVSELFFWYTSDFAMGQKVPDDSNDEFRKPLIYQYLKLKSPETIKEKLKKGDFKLVRMPWHWQLNEASL
ncbi:MAG: DUF547 domain-containing protein [Calditrichaeota bacterium]|nr:DUF547 domain-containing protein [Calditrichota bacterium]